MSLYWLIIAISISIAIAFDDIQSFSLFTWSGGAGPSSGTLTLTLWFNYTIFQCDIVASTASTTFECNSQSTSWTVIGSSGCYKTDLPQYKIMVANPTTADAVIISSITVTHNDGRWWTVDSWCLPNNELNQGYIGAPAEWKLNNNVCAADETHFGELCVDNDPNDCAPSKQIIYYDTSMPSVNSIGQQWVDGDNTVPNTVTCDPTSSPTTSFPTNNPIPIALGNIDNFYIYTSDYSTSQTTETITLTLWFNYTIFECNVLPSSISTAYRCDSSIWRVIGTSGCYKTPDTPQYKIMIDNSNTADAVILNYFTVTHSDGRWWGIESWCIENSLANQGYNKQEWIINDVVCGSNYNHYSYLCVDNQATDCSPGKQIVYFDINAPYQNRSASPWTDGSNLSIDTITCVPSLNPTNIPSATPTDPSLEPSLDPSFNPTQLPTSIPSKIPSIAPTEVTNNPTLIPSLLPTSMPSIEPHPTTKVVITKNPTIAPISTAYTTSPRLNTYASENTKDTFGKSNDDTVIGDMNMIESILLIIALVLLVTIVVGLSILSMLCKRKSSKNRIQKVNSTQTLVSPTQTLEMETAIVDQATINNKEDSKNGNIEQHEGQTTNPLDNLVTVGVGDNTNNNEQYIEDDSEDSDNGLYNRNPVNTKGNKVNKPMDNNIYNDNEEDTDDENNDMYDTHNNVTAGGFANTIK